MLATPVIIAFRALSFRATFRVIRELMRAQEIFFCDAEKEVCSPRVRASMDGAQQSGVVLALVEVIAAASRETGDQWKVANAEQVFGNLP
jgi:hypothetical protein